MIEPNNILLQNRKSVQKIDESLAQSTTDRMTLFLELDTDYKYLINDWEINMEGQKNGERKLILAYILDNDRYITHNLKQAKIKLEQYYNELKK